jgi:predicted glycoside hydrolase/deacetylase ChbG (UPF0249 family)
VRVTPLRTIRICADDYGIAPGVNRAILDLLDAGRIDATSVMMLPKSLDAGAIAALAAIKQRRPTISVGLHLTLTAPFAAMTTGRPFKPLKDMLLAALMRRLDGAALAAEARVQLAAFQTAFGRPPDHVDGHQHVHLFPQVRDAVLAAIAEAAPHASVRQCGRAGSWAARIADRKGLVLDILSATFRRRAARAGIATNTAFAGTYDFEAEADFAALFPRFLDSLPDGGLVMCHPGFVDAELRRLDPLTALREREYAYFMAEAFPQALADKNIALA